MLNIVRGTTDPGYWVWNLNYSSSNYTEYKFQFQHFQSFSTPWWPPFPTCAPLSYPTCQPLSQYSQYWVDWIVWLLTFTIVLFRCALLTFIWTFTYFFHAWHCHPTLPVLILLIIMRNNIQSFRLFILGVSLAIRDHPQHPRSLAIRDPPFVT